MLIYSSHIINLDVHNFIVGYKIDAIPMQGQSVRLAVLFEQRWVSNSTIYIRKLRGYVEKKKKEEKAALTGLQLQALRGLKANK